MEANCKEPRPADRRGCEDPSDRPRDRPGGWREGSASGKNINNGREVEGSKSRGSRRARPDGATLSNQSAELAEAHGVQSTGTKAGLFWEAKEWGTAVTGLDV